MFWDGVTRAMLGMIHGSIHGNDIKFNFLVNFIKLEP